ncbi:hypothetical protein D9613_011785 [Agrocybe pediades]|uniref:Uncharacterized protein n=1 Tax=Agrocybe pediades TaxID=84607 RepID=A0A8H4QKR1_9AGAR|nr:hypothetical protein D9613_011785 [Agrocybe pediades]
MEYATHCKRKIRNHHAWASYKPSAISDIDFFKDEEFESEKYGPKSALPDLAKINHRLVDVACLPTTTFHRDSTTQHHPPFPITAHHRRQGAPPDRLATPTPPSSYPTTTTMTTSTTTVMPSTTTPPSALEHDGRIAPS